MGVDALRAEHGQRLGEDDVPLRVVERRELAGGAGDEHRRRPRVVQEPVERLEALLGEVAVGVEGHGDGGDQARHRPIIGSAGGCGEVEDEACRGRPLAADVDAAPGSARRSSSSNGRADRAENSSICRAWARRTVVASTVAALGPQPGDVGGAGTPARRRAAPRPAAHRAEPRRAAAGRGRSRSGHGPQNPKSIRTSSGRSAATSRLRVQASPCPTPYGIASSSSTTAATASAAATGRGAGRRRRRRRRAGAARCPSVVQRGDDLKGEPALGIHARRSGDARVGDRGQRPDRRARGEPAEQVRGAGEAGAVPADGRRSGCRRARARWTRRRGRRRRARAAWSVRAAAGRRGRCGRPGARPRTGARPAPSPGTPPGRTEQRGAAPTTARP